VSRASYYQRNICLRNLLQQNGDIEDADPAEDCRSPVMGELCLFPRGDQAWEEPTRRKVSIRGNTTLWGGFSRTKSAGREKSDETGGHEEQCASRPLQGPQPMGEKNSPGLVGQGFERA